MTTKLPHGHGSYHYEGEADGLHKVKARWREHGANRSKRFTATTRTEAEDLAVDFLLATHRTRRDGRYVAPAGMTVSDVVEAHLERCAGHLTGRTVKTYRERTRSMIQPYLGNRPARDLTTLEVQQWIDRLGVETHMVKGKRVRKFAPASIHPAIAVLQGAYREAAILGIVPANVVQGVRRPKIPRKEVQVWTQDDARKLLHAVNGDDRFDALYTVALASGMRPGELRALQWRHVDLQRGVIHVRTTITRDDGNSEQIVDRTKRGRGRVIAISDAVVRKLTWHKARQAERRLMASTWEDLGLVFDRGDGHWLYQSHWQRRHRVLCAEAGVPAINHHALRHTAATIMLESGVHVKVVSEILGHASIQTTLDIYSHVSESLQRSAVDVVSGALFGSVVDDNMSDDEDEKLAQIR